MPLAIMFYEHPNIKHIIARTNNAFLTIVDNVARPCTAACWLGFERNLYVRSTTSPVSALILSYNWALSKLCGLARAGKSSVWWDICGEEMAASVEDGLVIFDKNSRHACDLTHFPMYTIRLKIMVILVNLRLLKHLRCLSLGLSVCFVLFVRPQHVLLLGRFIIFV